MLRTEEIRDDARLIALAEPWRALWRACPNATPFQSPSWLLPWWRAFGPDGELRAYAVWDADRLVGLAPTYVYDGRLLLIGSGNSDYLDILAEPAAVAPLGRALLEAGPLEFQQLREGATALVALDGNVSRQDACPVMRFSPETEHSAAWKASVVEWKRANNKGLLKVHRGGPRDVDWMCDLLVRFHTARWNGREEPGVLAQPRVRDSLRAAAHAFAADGVLRMSTLNFAGRDIAALMCLHHQGRTYCYMTGMDPEYTRLSPGKLIMWRSMEFARDEGALEYDLLRGQEKYKYRFGAIDTWNSCLRRS